MFWSHPNPCANTSVAGPSPATVTLWRACTLMASALHEVEEFLVGLRRLHLVEQEFHRGQLIHRMQQLAQDPDLLQVVRLDQQLFAARAGAVDVDGGIHALL